MGDPRVLHKLPQLSWRNLAPVPIEQHPYDVAHAQAAREYPYVPIGVGHDDTGTRVKLRARLLFLNTLIGGVTFYPDIWDEYRPALFDRSAGDMNHPDLGVLRARVITFSVAMDANTTAGIKVDVEWELTIDDPTDEVTLGGGEIDAESAAKEAAAAVSAVLKKYPDGVPDGLDIFEAFSSIKGQIGSAIAGVTGPINQLQGKIGSMVDSIESLGDPEMWPAATSLRGLWGALEDMKNTLEETTTREVGEFTTERATTLTAIAAERGADVAGLMQLNPALLAKPKVPKNTVVKFYRK